MKKAARERRRRAAHKLQREQRRWTQIKRQAWKAERVAQAQTAIAAGEVMMPETVRKPPAMIEVLERLAFSRHLALFCPPIVRLFLDELA